MRIPFTHVASLTGRMVIAIILFSSCSRFQYATISSSNMVMNEQKEFVAENDTLRLVYNFNGQYAPINVIIENKLNVPVYVDWRQSALIVNNKAISYMPNEVPITGEVSSSGMNWNAGRNSFTSSSGSISAVAVVPASVDFIPPHSHITKRPMGVINRMIENVPDSTVKRIRIPTSDGGSYSAKMANFTEANSPVQFRSYLTMAIGEAAAKPTVYEHGFYVSEILTSGLGPETMGYNSQNFGNRFYIRKVTGFGKAATGFGVIAGTAVIYGAAAALNPNNGQCNTCQ